MCSKGRIPSKKGPHNGAQVDRGGQQDGGKLMETFCRYARYSFHNEPYCAQPFRHIDSFQLQVHSDEPHESSFA